MSMQLKEVDFGKIEAGSVCKIKLPTAQGFFANALLERDGQKVASWESNELTGTEVERKTSAPGEYVLRVTLAFIGKDSVSVPVKLTVVDPEGASVVKTATLSGQKGDIGRVKVFAEVE